MIRVAAAKASEKLSDLADAALSGVEVPITTDSDGNGRVLKLVALPRSINRQSPRGKPEFGSAKGMIWMSEDFDEPIDEFEEYMR